MAYPSGFAGAPAPAAPAAAAPSAPAATDHPAYAPVLTLAAILAHAAQLPQQQTIHENQAAADAAAHAQQQTIQGYTQALAKLLQGVAPQVQQGYQQAAQTEGALGSAFGGQLAAQGAPANAQDQALLALSGGQANAGQIAAQTPGAALGNAAGWLGAGLPATGLNQAGAAFGAAASMLPGQVAGQGLQQIASIGARAQAADQGFGQKLDDLAAQYPGLLAKSAQQVQSQQAAQRSADTLARSREGALTGIDPATGQPTLEARKAQAAVDYQAAQVTIAQQKAAATEAYQKGELSARQYANQIAASRAASATALGAYNAQTSRINARSSATRASNDAIYKNAYLQHIQAGDTEKVAHDKATEAVARQNANTSASRAALAAAKQAAAKTGGGLSASGWRSLVSDANRQVVAGARSSPDRQQYAPNDPNAVNGFITVPGTAKAAVPYQQALATTLALGPGTARWRYKAKQIVDSHYGYGQDGRPWPEKLGLRTAINTAKLAQQHNLSLDDVRAKMQQAGLSPSMIEAALGATYFATPFSPVAGSPHYNPVQPAA